MLLATIPPPPGNAFELGPLTVHYYGVAIAIGVLVAVTLIRRRYASFGGDPELADRIALWAVFAGLVGARIGYVVPRLDRFAGDPLAILAIWEGGLVFFGGLFAGTAMAVYLVRRWGGDLPALADAVAPGIPLAQAFGRWGNYFNQELYGTSTDLPWALEIERGGQIVDTVHPTFLYEMLGNLLLVAVLILLGRRLKRGSLMFVYAIGYGVLRFAMEQIRTDERAFEVLFSANAWVSIGILLVGVAGLLWWRRRPAATPAGEAEAADGAAIAGGREAAGDDEAAEDADRETSDTPDADRETSDTPDADRETVAEEVAEEDPR
jgi:prolipoprotein diacylglyceryl transferase